MSLSPVVSTFIHQINTLFSTHELEKLSRETHFMKRQRKLKITNVVSAFMQAGLQPHPSLEGVSRLLHDRQITVSRQAVHHKTKEAGEAFLRALLEHVLAKSLPEHRTLLGINGILVIDSSFVGRAVEKTARRKIQALVDVLGYRMPLVEVTPGTQNDQSYRRYLDYVEKETVVIGDLGYFAVDAFEQIQKRSGYFLCRYFRRASVYDAAGKRMVLEPLLSCHAEAVFTCNVWLSRRRLPCRLIAMRLTAEQLAQRLAYRQRQGRRDPRQTVTLSVLDEWTILVTNLNATFTPAACYTLYSCRWQIELLFKLLKSRGLGIDTVDIRHGLGRIILLVKLVMAVLLLRMVQVSGVGMLSYGKVYDRVIEVFRSCILQLGKWTTRLVHKVLDALVLFGGVSSCRSRLTSLQKVAAYA